MTTIGVSRLYHFLLSSVENQLDSDNEEEQKKKEEEEKQKKKAAFDDEDKVDPEVLAA